MDRTQGENYTTIAGKRKFTDGPPGTCVEQEWLNSVQEEILACIEGTGLTPSSLDLTQLKSSIGTLAKVPSITLVSTATYTTVSSDEVILVAYSGKCKITLSGAPIAQDGKKITIINYSSSLVIVEAFPHGITYLPYGGAKSSVSFIFYTGINWLPFDQEIIPFGAVGYTAWTERANPKNFTLKAICWSPELSLFCAVGAGDGTDSYILTSPDGIVWTERAPTVPKNIQLNGVCWSDELTLFAAVGEADGADGYILTSPDGITWTERGNAKNVALNAVCWVPTNIYGYPGMFIAVGDSDGADAYMLWSLDGLTWTELANPDNHDLYAVAAQNSVLSSGEFIAFGNTTGDAWLNYQLSGTTQSAGNPPSLNQIGTYGSAVALYGVAKNRHKTVAVGASGSTGTDSLILVGGSSILNVEVANPLNLNIYSVIWTGTAWVAVGAAGATTGAAIMTNQQSEGRVNNGGQWVERANVKNYALYGVATNGKYCVAVGAADGADAYIITSLIP